MGKKKAASRGTSKKAEDAATSTRTARDAPAPAVIPSSHQRNDRARAPAEKIKAPLHAEDPRFKMLREYYGSGDWWFIQDYALANIAATLATQGWVCIDHFLSDAHTAALLSDIKRNGGPSQGEGRFQSGFLAGDGLGGGVRYSHSHVRGDEVFWSNGIEDEEKWSPFGNPALSFERDHTTLSLYLRRMDTLLAQLADPTSHNVADLAPLLGQVSDRSHAMVARYPGRGAGYVRHCDNHCTEGAGTDCNGRRVTAIVYLNEQWREVDGGELLLYRPPPKHDDPWCRIAPRAGTAILFWSDYRVPHEVLPSFKDRYAVTTWYYDKDEKEAARSRAAADNNGERAAAHEAKVAREIAEFEARTGKKADTTVTGRYDGARLQEESLQTVGNGRTKGEERAPRLRPSTAEGAVEAAQHSSLPADEPSFADASPHSSESTNSRPKHEEANMKARAEKSVPVAQNTNDDAALPLDSNSGHGKKEEEEEDAPSVEARVAAEAAARERLVAERARARDELSKAKAQKDKEEKRASEARAYARAAEKANVAATERANAKAAAKAAKAAAARALREREQAEALALETAAADAKKVAETVLAPGSVASAAEPIEGEKSAQTKETKKKNNIGAGPAAEEQNQPAAPLTAKSKTASVADMVEAEKPTKTALSSASSLSTSKTQAATAANTACTTVAGEAPKKPLSNQRHVELSKGAPPPVVAAVLVRSPAGQTEYVFEPPIHQRLKVLRQILV